MAAGEPGYHPEVAVQLRPTHLIRPPGLVDAAVQKLLGIQVPTACAVLCSAGQNSHKCGVCADERWGPGCCGADGLQSLQRPASCSRRSTGRRATWTLSARRRFCQEVNVRAQILPPVDRRATVDIDNLAD
jgi:hypothetical protein